MEHRDWLQSVRENATLIADIDRQRQAWRAGRGGVPDAIELFALLLDDCEFRDFLEQLIKPKDLHAYEIGTTLHRKMMAFPDEKMTKWQELHSDAEWRSIAETARVFSQLI